jgi:hypothetical protein
MNKVTIGAALATIAIAVPAGWRVLDADIQADGPGLKPKQQQLTIGDATITLDMDRGIMPAGGKASVTLVATAEHAHKVTVALRAMQDMGYGGERVPNPPQEVDRRTVTLDALPGGGPPVVATFKLAKKGKPGSSEWFDIFATAPKEKMKSRWDTGETTAAVGVATWSGNSFAMSIEPPATIPAEGPFTIGVRVKNTTKKPMKRPWINIGARIGGPQGLDSQLIDEVDDYKLSEVDQPDEYPSNEEGDVMVAPGAEYLAIYKIEPRSGIDHFTFVAQARSEEGGAMATTIVDRPQADDAPSVKVSRK